MIGILDSGIGGLTIAGAVMKTLPGYDIIYFGDTARTPYGTKSPEAVISYSLQQAAFLISQGAKLIVMASHAASNIAAETIAATVDAPVFEITTHAVDLAVNTSKNLQIGVIGTRATIESNIYEKKILQLSPGARVHSAACPMFVPLIEEGWFKRPETRMIVKKYLHPLKVRQIDTLILGCTHYPLFKDIIQVKIGKKVKLIDPAEGVVKEVKQFLVDHPDIDGTLMKGGTHKIFVSHLTEQFNKTAKTALKRNVVLEQVKIF